MRESDHMSQVRTSAAGYRFDDFYIDARNRQLWREGNPVALNSKYFDVLLMLVSRSGELVEKQRIFDEIWDGVFVTDSALTQCIKDIRRQLGDDASSPRYIKTVPKHGYVFIGNAVEAAAEASLTAGPSTRPTPAPRPYKFLDYYTEHDTQLFFGRENEIDVICSQIIARRSFILHGRSGVGKSSILRAGLMPRLKSHGHLVLAVRSFSDPLQQMAGALAQALDDSEPRTNEAALEGLIARAETTPARLVVFLLDQFEEFFSILGEESQRQFIDEIGRLAARGDLPLRLVFALREDFLAEMSRFKSAIPEIFHHEYRLTRLSRGQAAIAITGPANAVGCSYEPQLVERLLEDLGDGDSIDPPQLQIVCDRLYDSRDSEGRLTLEAYELLGTASQILAGYLERVLNRFDAPELRVAKAILTALISIDGRRLVLHATELAARAGFRSAEANRAGQLIEELVAARVVRRSRENGEVWLELAHDFLTPEVSRWLTDEERALKQARGVIERGMENYRVHELMIDADALDVLLPFGEELGLTPEEANLLAGSVLSRGRLLPDWLALAAPNVPALVMEASRHEDPRVRMIAVEACEALSGRETKAMLVRLALWDRDLGVRKAASIALTVSGREAAEDVLQGDSTAPRAGLIRRAVSLAMIRDYDKPLVRLNRLSLPVSALVVMGLMWVRVRRGWSEILREGAGGTFGGAASGVLGGLLLGAGLGWAQAATAIEAAKLVFVLISLGTLIGTIGGFGVSFGMVAASHVGYRHSRWWSVVGAAGGGAAVGGAFKLLSIDILRALFGQNPDGIAGPLEGALLGAGVSLGAVAIGRLVEGRARPWQKVLAASLGAMCAGIALTVIGGNLFSGSLEIVTRSFADSQIRMDPLASLFGEVQFGKTMQVIFGAIEGLLFGAGVGMGIEPRARQKEPLAGEV